MKKLTDLDPRWVNSGGAGITDTDGNPVPVRRGIGLTFACPCGCGVRAFVGLRQPLDGGPPTQEERALWDREGDTFETLSLRPSVYQPRAKGGCGWHGWVTDGVVTGQIES